MNQSKAEFLNSWKTTELLFITKSKVKVAESLVIMIVNLCGEFAKNIPQKIPNLQWNLDWMPTISFQQLDRILGTSHREVGNRVLFSLHLPTETKEIVQSMMNWLSFVLSLRWIASEQNDWITGMPFYWTVGSWPSDFTPKKSRFAFCRSRLGTYVI